TWSLNTALVGWLPLLRCGVFCPFFGRELPLAAEVGPSQREVEFTTLGQGASPFQCKVFAGFVHAAVALPQLSAARAKTCGLGELCGVLQVLALQDVQHRRIRCAPKWRCE